MKHANCSITNKAFWVTLVLAIVVYTLPFLVLVAFVTEWIPQFDVDFRSGWPIPLLYLIPLFWIPVVLFKRYGCQFAILYFVVIFGAWGILFLWFLSAV